jgi:hypothetical protein
MAQNELEIWANFLAVHDDLGVSAISVLETYLREWDMNVTPENLELALLATGSGVARCK